MKAAKDEYFTFLEYKRNFDGLSGLDSVIYEINDQTVNLIADNSPLDERVEKFLRYKPKIYRKKSYKAVWYILKNELNIMFVNGIVHGKRLFTYDFIPEHPSDALFFTYKYTGKLYLRVQQGLIPSELKNIINNDYKLVLEFKDGILMK